jgi:hypothetical protein
VNATENVKCKLEEIDRSEREHVQMEDLKFDDVLLLRIKYVQSLVRWVWLENCCRGANR